MNSKNSAEKEGNRGVLVGKVAPETKGGIKVYCSVAAIEAAQPATAAY